LAARVRSTGSAENTTLSVCVSAESAKASYACSASPRAKRCVANGVRSRRPSPIDRSSFGVVDVLHEAGRDRDVPDRQPFQWTSRGRRTAALGWPRRDRSYSRDVKIDDPELVRREYETERALAIRNRVFRDFARGTDPESAVVSAVAEAIPRRVLEVGCGTGELAARVSEELGSEVVALDLSPRMVELARARRVDARVGDVQGLPFPDREFDVVIAAWMLYHVPDLELALSEIGRVLRPGGRLVAATYGEGNLRELWALLGDRETRPHSFTTERAVARLEPHFERVEVRDASGEVCFPSSDAVREYVAASIRRSHLADSVPDLPGPFFAHTSQAVLVAEKRE
jgi:SAM-dependent methyltransferase